MGEPDTRDPAVAFSLPVDFVRIESLMPENLGARGRQLWDALREARPFNAAEVVLLEEVCRMADRLDRFDAVLSGEVDAWMRLTHRTRTEDYEIHIDEAAAEARQLAATFERLIAALKLPEAKAQAERDGIGDLAARRAARHAG